MGGGGRVVCRPAELAGHTELCARDDATPAKRIGARLRQLEAQLPPEVFAAAVARGRRRQIDEVVAELIGEPASQAADEAAALI